METYDGWREASAGGVAEREDVSMKTRHDRAQDCPHEWREIEPSSYGREYRVFRCGCTDSDVHLVRATDAKRAAEYEPG